MKVQSSPLYPLLLSANPILIITTSQSGGDATVQRALALANELDCLYIPRANLALHKLMAIHAAERALVVEGNELALVHRSGTTYRYHPNLGFVRALNLLRGQRDLFIESAQIQPGERVLDCTLGFGSEAMLASMAVGSQGTVVGLESVPELALLTREGLKNRNLLQPKLQEAMRRIQVVNSGYSEYLSTLTKGKFDLIYFDPFFHERIEGSETNINPLFEFGNQAPLDFESVIRAIALAKRRVVVKHPAAEELPIELIEIRSGKVSARKRPVVYSVFDSSR